MHHRCMNTYGNIRFSTNKLSTAQQYQSHRKCAFRINSPINHSALGPTPGFMEPAGCFTNVDGGRPGRSEALPLPMAADGKP